MSAAAHDFAAILGGELLERRGLEREFDGVFTSDSRRVSPGGVFVAVPGVKVDGHRFIADAVAAGVKVVIHQNALPEYDPAVTYLRCRSTARARALLARAANGESARDLALFGVTGTNGKTTTAFLLEAILNGAGRKCGLLSTVEYRDGSGPAHPATHTTPDSATIYRELAAMRGNGCSAAAMELSSHSLDQERAFGLRFRCAIFTNLTGDHLDYHGTMESYFAAKRRLFTELLADDGAAVLNFDDPAGLRLGRELAGLGRRVIGFGSSAAAAAAGGWRIADIVTAATGNTFTLISPDGGTAYEVASNLVGEHNVHNLTGALLAALAFGVSPAELDRVLAVPIAVPGRLELFRSPSGAAFYVDYAHTDDAIRRVLEALRPLTAGKLAIVFGAGGDRDRTKRPRMGRAAGELADRIYLTSDNPRSEDPLAIMREVAAGIPTGVPVITEPDRREALRRAAAEAAAGDVVLVAGKGHEDYQEINGVRRHYSDREFLRELFGTSAPKND